MSNEPNFIKNMITEIWANHNILAINKYFANSVVYDNFIERIENKQQLVLVIKKFYKAFSENIVTIISIISKKDIIFVKWIGQAKQVKMFYGLKPSLKTVKFNVIGFYKVKDSLITHAVTVSNLKFNLIKHDSFPNFVNGDNIKNIDVKEILFEIQNLLNIPLTNQEIATTSLWLTGYSNKASAKILDISSRTVEEYRTRIKCKLNVNDKKQLYDFIRYLEVLEPFLELADKLSSNSDY